MPIHKLSDDIINQIAAGEVVERPSSVVKELVENAIDAEATTITIEIKDGGKERIKVTDNGTGIPKDELELAVTRHATSKITSSSDLESIASLGFRGEALASIAAVSDFTIQSRQAGQNFGYALEVTYGKLGSTEKKGMAEGTSISIDSLFDNLPARKKFLKTAATENKYISQFVTAFALSYPGITFIYQKDGKDAFRVQQVSSHQERVQQVWDADFMVHLLPVFFDHPHLQIHGYVGKIDVSGKKAEQWMFVNNRWIDDRTIHAAVRDAYGGLLPPKGRPFFILYLDTPPHMVDVNVHPRKEEVRFASSSFVFNSVKQAVRKALESSDMTPGVTMTREQSASKDEERIMRDSYGDRSFRHSEFISESKKTGIPNQVRDDRNRSYNYAQSVQHEFVHDGPSKALPWEEQSTDKAAPFHIFDNVYIFTFGDVVTIYDQHALHERVLYEQFKQLFENEIKESEVQSLLIPQSVTLNPSEWETFQETKEIFKTLGFEIEEKGNNVLQILAVPVSLKDSRIRDLMPTVLDEWGQMDNVTAEKDLALAYMACRSAVKAGDRLTPEEVQGLLSQIDSLDEQYTCPHGRPFRVTLDRKELDKWFKRSGFD